MKNGASDRLFRAENGSLTAQEVFDNYEAQIGEELGPCGDPEIDAGLAQSEKEMREAIAIARELWTLYGGGEDAIIALLESDNCLVCALGDALDTGDYADLAI
jgi:hypothetical protein